MPWPYPTGQTVTVLDGTVTGQDGDGNDVRLYPPKFDLANVAVAPADANAQIANEFTNARDQVAIGLTLYVPIDADIVSVDRVIVWGTEYEVTNQPEPWISPWSAIGYGKTISLSRYTG